MGVPPRLRCTPLLLAGACAFGLDLSRAPLPGEGALVPTAADFRWVAPFTWVPTWGGPGDAGLVAETAGDLDGDGIPDAVGVLAANYGGTGCFHSLVAWVDRHGAAQVMGSAWLGDRIRLHRVRIAGGVVSILLTVGGDGDAACCPTHVESRGWRLAAEGLIACWSYALVAGEPGLVPDSPHWWKRCPWR